MIILQCFKQTFNFLPIMELEKDWTNFFRSLGTVIENIILAPGHDFNSAGCQ